MTKNETIKLLEVLRVAYPNYYKNMSKDEASKTASLYHSRLKDYPVTVVVEALNSYIDENEYPPTIAGIKKYLTRLEGEHDYEIMWMELWSAICGNRKFEDLCPANQKYIGSQTILDTMGMDEHTLHDVVRGQYMRRIPEIVDSMKFAEKVELRIGTEGVETLKAKLKGTGRLLIGGRA